MPMCLSVLTRIPITEQRMTTMTYQPPPPPPYQPLQGTNVANQIGSYSYGADGGNVNPSNISGVPIGKAIATQGAIMAANTTAALSR